MWRAMDVLLLFLVLINYLYGIDIAMSITKRDYISVWTRSISPQNDGQFHVPSNFLSH